MNYLFKNKINYVEQEPKVINDTVLYNVIFKQNMTNSKEFELYNLFKKFGMCKDKKTFNELIYTKVSDMETGLSGGEKQKISLIRSIFNPCDLMILDEPTSALDKESKVLLIDILRTLKNSKIILLSTHDKDLIEKCDDLVILDK